MVTLSIGLAVLVCAAIWASYASEAAWVAFFESLPRAENAPDKAEEDKLTVQARSNACEADSQADRITALPSLHQSRIRVVR